MMPLYRCSTCAETQRWVQSIPKGVQLSTFIVKEVCFAICEDLHEFYNP